MALQTPPYRIETPRLVIRCYNPGTDAALLKESLDASKSHLLKWMPWAAFEPQPVEQKIELLRKFRGQFDLGIDYVYGIFNKEETRVIGGTGLHLRRGPYAIEIGYWMDAREINKGYVTEATKALTIVGLKHCNSERMDIKMNVANIASKRVPEKLGYNLDGTLRKDIKKNDGSFCDAYLYSLNKEELAAKNWDSFELKIYGIDGKQLSL